MQPLVVPAPELAARGGTGNNVQVELGKNHPGQSRRWWHGVHFAWLILALFLVLSVPLFVCMPLWTDASHYDLCARNLLQGGVAYRDAFDTNLPGIIWLQAGFRWLFGWRSETLRLFDLAIYALIVALGLRFLRHLDISPLVRSWTAVALFVYYLGTGEDCHCQRDCWMLLPSLGALHLRLRQSRRLLAANTEKPRIFLWGMLEGLCWGAAVWVKPFVMIVALACWWVNLRQVKVARTGVNRRLLRDTLGLLAGGLIAGALGMTWLWRSGAWPYFWDIMLHWNPEYREAFQGWGLRTTMVVDWGVASLPWGLLTGFVALLGLLLLIQFHRRSSTHPTMRERALNLLNIFFLAWFFQAAIFQAPHNYVLNACVPPSILLLVGMIRPRQVNALVPASLAGLACLILALHPALNPKRIVWWYSCLSQGSSAKVRDALRVRPGSGAGNWVELEKVYGFLQKQQIQDGELVCFHDSTNTLYLSLNVKPGTRFFQWAPVIRVFVHEHPLIQQELENSKHRFIVSDMLALGLTWDQFKETPPGQPLPVPSYLTNVYPWNEPVVFRAGRYQVHKRTQPVQPFWILVDGKIQKPRPVGSSKYYH